MLERDIETVLSEIAARIASDTEQPLETVRETVDTVYSEMADQATVTAFLPVLTERITRKHFQQATR